MTALRRCTLLAVVVALCLSGCDIPAPTFPTAVSTVPTASPGTALSVLETLPVKGRAPMTGYSRSVFMPHGWEDPDGNGCDARRDVLARQAVADVVRRGAHQCVFTATIADPYSGATVPSTAADVDHVVALGDAWQTGAQARGAAEREALAQDPLNLVATSASLNRSKGDADAATWLPPNTDYRCAYVARIIAVKAKFKLWMKPAERDAIARVLASCPGQQVPA